MTAIAPPPALDAAHVLEYALVDDSVRYTGRLHLSVNGERIGRVPYLAICRHLFTSELLLAYCDEEWNVLAIEAWNGPAATPASSIEEVKRRAESYYEGISKKWIQHTASKDDAKAYYADQEKRRTCSFCGRPPREVKILVTGKSGVICNLCIDEYHEVIHTPSSEQ